MDLSNLSLYLNNTIHSIDSKKSKKIFFSECPINLKKLKKAKRKIQWAKLACWISQIDSFALCAGNKRKDSYEKKEDRERKEKSA